MKYEIIDWVGGYDSVPPEGEVTFAKRNRLIDEIRREGYLFSGEDHQDEYPCVPVFNDGTRYETSRRGWGRIMAEAYHRYGLYDYSLFTENFSIPPEERCYPFAQTVTPTDEDWAVFEAADYDGPDPFDMAMERYNKTMEALSRGEDVLYPGAVPREELAEQFDIEANSKGEFDEFARKSEVVFTVPENSELCRSLRYLDKGDTINIQYNGLSRVRRVADVDYRKIYTQEDADRYKEIAATDLKEAEADWLTLPIRITIKCE